MYAGANMGHPFRVGVSERADYHDTSFRVGVSERTDYQDTSLRVGVSGRLDYKHTSFILRGSAALVALFFRAAQLCDDGEVFQGGGVALDFAAGGQLS
jgi:hypothetical protein